MARNTARRVQTLDQETLPEADRAAPFPHPRETRHVCGHADAQSALAEALTSGRSHHAWLITGPPGIGKATLCYAATRYWLSAPEERCADLSVPDESVAARQVAALSHPGLLVVRRPYDTKTKRFRTVITVDEMRRVLGFVQHTSGGDGRRAIIIDAVDDLNTSAANAVLKSLEEPPPQTLFFMVCAQPGRVLPTIRSRCRTLALAPLGNDEVAKAAQAAIDAADPPVEGDMTLTTERIASAKGSPGRLLTMLAGVGAALTDAVDAVFKRLPDVDWVSINRLADDVARADQTARFDLFSAVFLDRLADATRSAACGEAAGSWASDAGPAVLA
ncbi:MAG: DNA polymerase III subunit delta', partial [Pseudomonadota bacterium]